MQKPIQEQISDFVDSFDEDKRIKWNDETEWWEPAVYFDDSEFYDGLNVSWQCDNLGDAQDVMEAMWCEILKLRRASGMEPCKHFFYLNSGTTVVRCVHCGEMYPVEAQHQ